MIIYAHNINTGGSLVLLEELLIRMQKKDLNGTVYLNNNILNRIIKHLPQTESLFLEEGAFSQLLTASGSEMKLYFGNLPPLLPAKKSAVYVHNAYYTLPIISILKGIFNKSIAKKYLILNLYFRLFHRNCDYVFVQTPGMKRALEKISVKPVKLMPFYRSPLKENTDLNAIDKVTDICAIGLPSRHKNYQPFLNAILKLVESGYKFKVEMTIPTAPENQNLLNTIEKINGLNDFTVVENHGFIDFETVKDIYSRSKALVFPSMLESFGLPLIEAAECGLKIFVPDLPYADDVIGGYTVFDPLDEENIFSVLQEWFNNGLPVSAATQKVEDKGWQLLIGDWNE